MKENKECLAVLSTKVSIWAKEKRNPRVKGERPFGLDREEARNGPTAVGMMWAERPAEMAFLGLVWACFELGFVKRPWARAQLKTSI